MKHLKLARNSLVSKLGNRSNNKACVKLQAYSNTYAFPYLCIFKILQRSHIIDADDLKGVWPSVRSLERSPRGGDENAWAWNRQQPWQLVTILLVNLLRCGTQYSSRTFAMVLTTPLWSIPRWNCATSFSVKRWLSAKYTGKWTWILPRHSNMPTWFGCRFCCNRSSS